MVCKYNFNPGPAIISEEGVDTLIEFMKEFEKDK